MHRDCCVPPVLLGCGCVSRASDVETHHSSLHFCFPRKPTGDVEREGILDWTVHPHMPYPFLTLRYRTSTGKSQLRY